MQSVRVELEEKRRSSNQFKSVLKLTCRFFLALRTLLSVKMGWRTPEVYSFTRIERLPDE